MKYQKLKERFSDKNFAELFIYLSHYKGCRLSEKEIVAYVYGLRAHEIQNKWKYGDYRFEEVDFIKQKMLDARKVSKDDISILVEEGLIEKTDQVYTVLYDFAGYKTEDSGNVPVGNQSTAIAS
jgi:hypothetical protein